MKKRLGILGGMGPQSTSVFYDKLIRETNATRDQDHIDTMILSHATLPDRTEVIKSGDDTLLLDLIKKDFEMFEAYGIQNIAIPCNTLHFFYDKLVDMTDIPIISMPAVSFRGIAGLFGDALKIGVLATDGTVQAGVYDKEAKHFKFEIIYPDKEDQKIIMNSIYKLKATGCLKFEAVDKVIENMLQTGCDIILLACTELSIMELSPLSQEKCVDAMEFLIEESIRLSQERE